MIRRELWSWHDLGNELRVMVGGRDGKVVAYLPVRRSGPQAAQNRRNAYLLAAAPAMLEALQTCRILMQDDVEEDTLAAIDTVIAIAKGTRP